MMRPIFVLCVGIVLDIAVAHTSYIPWLHTYQCMLFYLFGKEMITWPWCAFGLLWYIPMFGISWWLMAGYIGIAYAIISLQRIYVIMHPILYTSIVWVLLMLYMHVVQPDVAATWGVLWTQMVIFVNIMLGKVLRHTIRQGK